MKRMKFLVLTLCALIVLASTAFAADTLIIATGGKTGTYHRLFTEIAKVINSPAIDELESGGSVDNVNKLLGNEANLGIVQADVLWAKLLVDNDPAVGNIKTLMALHPEQVHMIVLNNSSIRNFSDLGNKRIAAWGGSITTANVLFGKTSIRPLRIDTQYGTPDAAIAALQKGSVDCVLAVGGQPLGWVKALPAQYRLVNFDKFDGKVSEVYQSAVLNSYVNLNQTGVKTVSIHALLVTMDYKSQSKVSTLLELRRNILSKLDDLRETTGFHPAWRTVDTKNNGSWVMFTPVATKAAATAEKPVATGKGKKPIPAKSVE